MNGKPNFLVCKFNENQNCLKTFFSLDGLTFPPIGNPPTRNVINIFQSDFCR